MNITTITPPAVEPVNLADSKLYLKVDTQADDAVITGLIVAARLLAETYTRRAFVTQTLDIAYDRSDLFAYGPEIELPLAPIASITSVKSYDASDAESTMEATDYRISGESLVLTSGASWPTDLRARDAIIVRCVAGYGDATAVPEPIKTAINAMVMQAYEARQGITPDAGLMYLAPYRRWLL